MTLEPSHARQYIHAVQHKSGVLLCSTPYNVLELAGKLLAKYAGLGGLMRAEFGEL
jgi:hypothetical protein